MVQIAWHCITIFKNLVKIVEMMFYHVFGRERSVRILPDEKEK